MIEKEKVKMTNKDFNTDLMDVEQESKAESAILNVIDGDIDKEISSKPIHKSMIISEVVDSHPDVIPLLIQNGMHCIGCGASMFETLEEGFLGHGMDDAEIERIVDDLNKHMKNASENKDTDD